MQRHAVPARPRVLIAATVAALIALLAAGGLVPTAASAAEGEVVEIFVLSGRADLVSAGDALVEVTVPSEADPTDLVLDVEGRDVTSAFAVRSDGRYLGVVDDLALGDNVLTAVLPDGRGARITLRNHPKHGPTFSGPQIQPWACAGAATDEFCNREATYTFHYKPAVGSGFQTWTPSTPAFQVASTTTDEGVTVPFIVRQEVGVIDRDEYRIALLYQPDQEWTATEPQEQWNHKTVITHGMSCDTSYGMAASPDVMLEAPLGKGFAVMSHALDHAGHNCNIATQAESLVMTKEHLADTYGELRYTIGTGCSGGALAQQQVANAYPGVYQAITPACSFADAWSTAMQYIDYVLLRNYYENPQRWGTPWALHQIAAVYGHPNYANPVSFTTAIPNSGEPTRNCPGITTAMRYDENTNPTGVRCTLHDYMVNIFGRDPQTGFALRPWDNTGVQYGLSALLDGTLLPSQFVDLNTKLGGFDDDLTPIADRVAAPEVVLERLYRSGAVNTGSNLDRTAIIDLRGPDPGAFHDVYRTYVMRQRLEDQHGHADNQVLWRGSVALLGDATFTNEAIFAADRWIGAVEADERPLDIATKLLEHKELVGITDRCTDGSGQDVPAAYCDTVVESYSSPRLEAGMPLSEDIIKCQLQPLDRAGYDVTFTDAEWAALEATFPDGVCDYTQPGIAQQDTIEWQTYAGGEGTGTGLGPAPVSVPFGPAAAGPTTPAPSPLPATGGGLALAGLLLAGLAVALRRRP